MMSPEAPVEVTTLSVSTELSGAASQVVKNKNCSLLNSYQKQPGGPVEVVDGQGLPQNSPGMLRSRIEEET
jgi:hypothetical protein